MTLMPRRALLGLGLVTGTGLAVAACSPQPGTSTSAPSGEGAGEATAITHVHAITRAPADGAVLLATHEGLYRLEDGDLTRAGPIVDLMGFTIAADGRYLASGHPGLGVDLPEPLGLAESADGGQSWSVLSRGGESDFHALAAGPAGIIAFDGQLRFSPDGRTWQMRAIPSAPVSLAVSPKSGAVLAATENGVLRSTDDGASWSPLNTPQLASLVAWADDRTIAATGIDGRLLTSTDAGANWTSSEEPLGEITALGASRTDDGDVEALLMAKNQVLRAVDGGATTQQLL